MVLRCCISGLINLIFGVLLLMYPDSVHILAAIPFVVVGSLMAISTPIFGLFMVGVGILFFLFVNSVNWMCAASFFALALGWVLAGIRTYSLSTTIVPALFLAGFGSLFLIFPGMLHILLGIFFLFWAVAWFAMALQNKNV